MYVYQVTDLTTKQFYIGITHEPKESFDPVKKTDPAGVFSTKVSNGTKLQIHGCEKRMLARAGSEESLINIATSYAKKYENEPAFQGLFGMPSTKPKQDKPKDSKPFEPKTPPEPKVSTKPSNKTSTHSTQNKS